MTNSELLLSILGLILTAVSLLFVIFTAGIAIVAILEWRSYKDFQRKKKEAELQYKQITNQLIKDREDFRKEASTILGKVKKGKDKKHIKEQEKRLEELISIINKTIEKAEYKLSTTETSFPLTTNISGSTFTTTAMPYNYAMGGVSSNDMYGLKKCIKCLNYYPPLVGSTLDNGMCDKCNGRNGSSFITISK